MRLAIDIRTLFTHKARGLGSALMLTLEGLHRDGNDNEYILLVDIFNYSNSASDLVENYFPSFRDVLADPRFTLKMVPEYSHIFGSYEQTWEQVRLRRSFPLQGNILFYGYNFLTPTLADIHSVVHAPDVFVKTLPDQHSLEQKRILKWGEICMREAGLVTTLSESSKRDIVAYYGIPAEKVEVVYPPVNQLFGKVSDPIIEDTRRKLGLPKRFLLSVGVIEPRKNMLNAVRALKIYNSQSENELSLVVVGEVARVNGKLYTEVTDEIIRLGLRNNVMILGFVDNNQLKILYNMAEALVFPSFYEGFGLPPLEAMLCGAPVIVSDVSSMPEIVDDAGEYMDPHDPQSIASAIGRVIDDNERRERLVERGFAVTKRFTMEKRTERLLSVLGSHYSSIFPD